MTPAAGEGERTLAGLLWAMLAVLMASFLLCLPRLAGGDIPTLQVVFFRYLAGTATIAPVYAVRAMMRRRAGTVRTGVSAATTGLHVVRAAMAVTRIACFVYAVTHMPFANAQAVSLTNGVFMMLFGALILSERVNAATILAAAICLAGAVIAAEPSSDATLYLSSAALAALAGAAIWGLEATVIRYTALRDRADRILTFVNAAALALVALPGLALWQPLSSGQVALLAAMGPIAIATQISNVLAFRSARASVLAPVRYMAIVFALGLGLILFREWPSATALSGMVLVAGGGLLLTMLAASHSLRTTWLRP